MRPTAQPTDLTVRRDDGLAAERKPIYENRNADSTVITRLLTGAVNTPSSPAMWHGAMCQIVERGYQEAMGEFAGAEIHHGTPPRWLLRTPRRGVDRERLGECSWCF